MNIAQMLAYGPKLEKTYCSSRPKTEKSRSRVGDKAIAQYRELSINGEIWTTLIAPKLGIQSATASRNLLDLSRRGYLKECGRVKASTSSNKPILYRWIDGRP